MLFDNNFDFEESLKEETQYDDTETQELDSEDSQEMDTEEPELETGEDDGSETEGLEDESTSKLEDIEGSTEEIEIEIPEYIEDEFIPPDTFKSAKEESAWYKENYTKLLAKFSGEDFVENVSEAYKEQLIEKEKEVEKLKALDTLFKGQPDLAVKLYAPKYLAQKGYSPIITDDEAKEMVSQQLRAKYGKNFEEVYKPEEAHDPETISGMMWQTQQEILHHIKQQREEGQKLIEEFQPPDPIKIQEYLDETYRTSFEQAGFSKEEFGNFVKEAREYTPKMSLEDVHFVLNKENYLEEAYQNGFAEGKKTAAKNLNKAVSTPDLDTDNIQQRNRRMAIKANGVMSFSSKYRKITGF